MAGNIILYVSESGPHTSSISAALEATGYDVVSTENAMQAIALVYVMHSVAAVVLDQYAIEEASSDLTHSLRAICPCVPIILLCADRIDRLPSGVDYCVNAEQTIENIISELHRLLDKNVALSVAIPN